jgi:tetratricopeptide (TPR) repeat protein
LHEAIGRSCSSLAALVEAGERAASLGAAAEAQRYFEQAGELAGGPVAQAAALARAGEMALTAGANEQAGSLFEQAIALYEATGDTHAAARASGWLAQAEQTAGRGEEAIERMERAYAVIADDKPDADLALLLARLGNAHWFAGNLEQAAEWTDRCLDLAEALQLPEALARGWDTKAIIVTPRRPEEARGLFQLALDTALAHQLHARATVVYANLSDLGFRRDRYQESLAHLEQALELARRIGDRGSEWFVLSEMTHALTMVGRWDDALNRYAEIPDKQLGTSTQLMSLLTGVLELYLHRGELDQARQLRARWDELAQTTGDVQVQGGYHAATAAIRLAEGSPRDALSAAERAFAGRSAVGIASQDVKLGFQHALEAAVALGDADKAEDLLAVVEGLPVGLRPPLLAATVRRFRARLAGDTPAADSNYAAGANEMRALELPFHHAVVALEHAEWLIRQERAGEAEPLLTRAGQTFEQLQATPWLERKARAITPAGREADIAIS